MIGAGYSTAAKTPQEQKMAGILGGWRSTSVTIFYILIACALITFLNHKNFAANAHAVRQELAVRVADDVLKNDPQAREAVKAAVAQIPVIVHEIGVDPPLSQESNPDTQFLEVIHEALLDEARRGASAPADADAEGHANDTFQQCRTLFNQLNLSVTMRALLPSGLFGLFVLLLFLAMLSTDDSRIYSATLTIAQDVVLPLRKTPFTPRGHLWMIRIVAICIGVFFLFGSYYMKQLDYIHMFNQLAVSMWTSGAGPVMTFGLYSSFGTTAGAWTALLTSTFFSILYVAVQRNWADIVYPWLSNAGLVEKGDRLLRALSSPFEPYIHWQMDAVKCPVNTIEFTFFLMLLTFALYVVVSKLTCKEPFNLERMLHRGKYDTGDHGQLKSKWTLRTFFPKLVGVTPEYTRGDKVIAYGVFLHSLGYSFCGCFLGSIVWNTFHRWPLAWWGRYFIVVNFVVPCIIAAISTVWFGVGGFFGLVQLFRDLEARKEQDLNALDDGRVEGTMSLADKARLEAVDKPGGGAPPPPAKNP